MSQRIAIIDIGVMGQCIKSYNLNCKWHYTRVQRVNELHLNDYLLYRCPTDLPAVSNCQFFVLRVTGNEVLIIYASVLSRAINNNRNSACV